MNNEDFKTICRKYMNMHMEDSMSWEIGFIKTKNTLGRCDYRRKRLEFSIYYLAAGTDEEITNTITHEIAHAKVGPGKGHGWVWKSMHQQLGGTAERCTSLSHETNKNMTELVPSKYISICKKCGRREPKARKPKRRQSCGQCNPRRFDESCEMVVHLRRDVM